MKTQLKMIQTIKKISKIMVDSLIDEIEELKKQLFPRTMILSQPNKFYNVSLNLEI